MPSTLIVDLDTGTAFTSGKLTGRLLATDLSNLEPDQARAVGAAVGRRSARETFNVRREGVTACADSDDLSSWPAAYRRGVLRGLFLRQNGRLQLSVTSSQDAARVIAPSDTAVEDIRALLEDLPLRELVGVEFRTGEIHSALVAGAGGMPEQPATLWRALADRFAP